MSAAALASAANLSACFSIFMGREIYQKQQRAGAEQNV
jgi:hypothetical protein